MWYYEGLPIQRREGITSTERELKQLCEHSFLSLWSYSGVYHKDNHGNKEVCDLLVVFQDHIIIFSDKACEFNEKVALDVGWKRWFRDAIQKSARQALAAEAYIKKNPSSLFLDPACTQRFPIALPDLSKAIFHRILVTHGASKHLLINPAVKHHLKSKNVPQKLENDEIEASGEPFTIGQFTSTNDALIGYIHVFDDMSLSNVMLTLDTINDFVAYLKKKEEVIQSGLLQMNVREEDLLAYYLQHSYINGECYFMLPGSEEVLDIQINLWDKFSNSPERKNQIEADRLSYFWDKLIENFNKGILNGTTSSYSVNPSNKFYPEQFMSEIVMRFLARETRWMRRVLGKALIEVLKKKKNSKWWYRIVHPRTSQDTCYVFLVFSRQRIKITHEERMNLLSKYAIVAKLICPQSQHILGIAFQKDTEMKTLDVTEVGYLNASEWSEEHQNYAQQLQQKTHLLHNLETFFRIEKKYPTLGSESSTPHISHSFQKMNGKNRNKPCLCGSGKKYKNCHGL